MKSSCTVARSAGYVGERAREVRRHEDRALEHADQDDRLLCVVARDPGRHAGVGGGDLIGGDEDAIDAGRKRLLHRGAPSARGTKVRASRER